MHESAPPTSRSDPPPTTNALGTGWSWLLALTWGLIVVAVFGVWRASRDTGLPVWWIGPLSDPQPTLVSLAPIAPPTIAALGAIGQSRRAPWYGLGAATSLVIVAVIDWSDVRGFAITELILAASGAATSIAALLAGGGRPTRQSSGIDGDRFAP